jgi:endonuclease III-like uncharacterized protein
MNQHQYILHVVASVTEQPASEILSSARHTEAVDARHIYIALLRDIGTYNQRIAKLCGMSTRAVNHILSNFESRLRYSLPMRNNLARIRKILGESADITSYVGST